MWAKLALTLGVVVAVVAGLAPWFEVKMAMFYPALGGVACAGIAWWRTPRDRTWDLAAQLGFWLNLLTAVALLLFAAAFSGWFAQRFAATPAASSVESVSE